MRDKVVITGLGAISALGQGKDVLIQGVRAGESCQAPITNFDTSEFRCKKGCLIKENNLPQGSGKDKALQLLLYAFDEAVRDAKFSGCENGKTLLLIGSIYGGIESWEKVRIALLRNEDFDRCALLEFPLWALTEKLKTRLGRDVTSATISTACASSDSALGIALNAIRRKKAEVAIVGGVELVSRFIFAGFNSLNSLTLTECKPFDKNRDGLVLGEGAGVLVLESASHAEKRRTRIYAELAGFGSCFDAYDLAAPEPKGHNRSISILNALQDSNTAVEEVDFIKTHGTGTLSNDRVECIALKKVFKDEMYSKPISSIKAVIGHTCGACGSLEGIISISCIQDNCIPPIANFQEPDPAFQFEYVYGMSRSHPVNTVVQLAAGFGGSNTCLIFKRYQA
ncbi:MAG: beta-ketoacyl-[acyl-carrier-protein] synthase family protein [Desulfobacteraceae bacterium]